MAMKVSIDEKRKKVMIELDLTEPTLSDSGKTLSIASSRGNKETEATVNGMPVFVGVNAYIYANKKQ